MEIKLEVSEKHEKLIDYIAEQTGKDREMVIWLMKTNLEDQIDDYLCTEFSLLKKTTSR